MLTDWRLIREQPPDDERCPICGSPLNAEGRCMDEKYHPPEVETDSDPL